MDKIKKISSKLNSKLNSNSNSNGKKGFLNLPNIFYILLVSFCVCVILLNFLGLRTIRNIFEVYIIVVVFTVAVLYQLLKKKKMSLDKLEMQSVLCFIGFLVAIGLFGLFLKFTSMEKDSVEGKVFALVFLLLVFALVNLIFFIIGMG
tara:strand:- start:157 stop:600 length:444 start_codon:yes stop_codon:yes gene_type:complete